MTARVSAATPFSISLHQCRFDLHYAPNDIRDGIRPTDSASVKFSRKCIGTTREQGNDENGGWRAVAEPLPSANLRGLRNNRSSDEAHDMRQRLQRLCVIQFFNNRAESIGTICTCHCAMNASTLTVNKSDKHLSCSPSVCLVQQKENDIRELNGEQNTPSGLHSTIEGVREGRFASEMEVETAHLGRLSNLLRDEVD